MSKAQRIVIVGGVAGGASCAARARRLNEKAQILLFERGPHVSFANCGLPYFLGREITDPAKLQVQTPGKLKATLAIDVRVRSEVVRIDRKRRCVEVKDLESGRVYSEKYDALVLSPGAAPIRPPIPGIDRPGLFSLRNIPDMEGIDQWIERVGARTAVVVGGGYIGLEMAEQLHARGLEVSLAEAQSQVMAPLDPDMAEFLHRELHSKGVNLFLCNPVERFENPMAGESAAAASVVLRAGDRLPADVVILGLGVCPETHLAREAGLEIGDLGGIRTDDHLRTNDPSIYAIGDAIEVRHRVLDDWTLLPLAGPANRQGRIVADNLNGMPTVYKGSWGTGILRVFGLTAGCTGANSAQLRQRGISFEAVDLHPIHHAGYYPGARPLSMRVLFDPVTGRLLGAQVVGQKGVDKRVDVFATALAAGMTVDDLAGLELAYAPPFGSAKDPVNLAGMAAQNVKEGLVALASARDVRGRDGERTALLDVRNPDELARTGTIDGAINIPLNELRSRLDELAREREWIVYCASGQRSYMACRILSQEGFRCRNFSGSFKTWQHQPNG